MKTAHYSTTALPIPITRRPAFAAFTATFAALLLAVWPANVRGQVRVWGSNDWNNLSVPEGTQSGVTAVAAGGFHTVALKSDGRVLAWGKNDKGQTAVPEEAQSGVIAIAAGASHTVALKSDGSVLAWGDNGWGQTTVPKEAKSGVTAIAAGEAHTVALKSDGSVLAWGDDHNGRTTVPEEAQSGVTAIAAGQLHTVALKSDGSVLAWGYNAFGETTVPKVAQSGVMAIAAGHYYTVVLKSDGSVFAWGAHSSGQTKVPVGAHSGVTAIAAGYHHAVALKGGSVLAWGKNDKGQTAAPPDTQSGVMAIAAGEAHTVAFFGYQAMWDGSFQKSVLNGTPFTYHSGAPAGQPWSFAGNSGVAQGATQTGAGPGFNVMGQAPGPYAFLQTDADSVTRTKGSISQTVTFPAAGAYQLDYLVAGRTAIYPYFGGAANYVVTISGGVLSAPDTTTDGQPFTARSHPFTIPAAGSYTLTFTNAGPAGTVADATALIGNVTILPARLPGSWTFENPKLGVSALASLSDVPAGQPWTFAGNAGLAKMGAAPGYDVTGPTYGQYAFLQATATTGNATISQILTFPAAGAYELDYLVAGRTAGNPNFGGAAKYSVTISGGVLSAQDTTKDGQPFLARSRIFTVPAAGNYTLTFANTGPAGSVADATVLIDNVMILPFPLLGNWTFESPALGGSPFVNPTSVVNSTSVPAAGQPWTFAGNAGIAQSDEASGYGVSGPTHGQYAFLQTTSATGNGTMSQTLMFPVAGTYELDYLVAGRTSKDPNFRGAANYSVTVSGGVFTRSDTTANEQVFTVKTCAFKVPAAGSYTVTFTNTGPAGSVADATVLIDNVKLFLEPPPPH